MTQSGGTVAVAYKFLCVRQRKTERFQSCVSSSDVIFVMQLLWPMKQSSPSGKIRLFVKWEEGDSCKAWNQKALVQKLETFVSFHYSIFTLIFFPQPIGKGQNATHYWSIFFDQIFNLRCSYRKIPTNRPLGQHKGCCELKPTDLILYFFLNPI